VQSSSTIGGLLARKQRKVMHDVCATDLDCVGFTLLSTKGCVCGSSPLSSIIQLPYVCVEIEDIPISYRHYNTTKLSRPCVRAKTTLSLLQKHVKRPSNSFHDRNVIAKMRIEELYSHSITSLYQYSPKVVSLIKMNSHAVHVPLSLQ
jgi:hypothetical protein